MWLDNFQKKRKRKNNKKGGTRWCFVNTFWLPFAFFPSFFSMYALLILFGGRCFLLLFLCFLCGFHWKFFYHCLCGWKRWPLFDVVSAIRQMIPNTLHHGSATALDPGSGVMPQLTSQMGQLSLSSASVGDEHAVLWCSPAHSLLCCSLLFGQCSDCCCGLPLSMVHAVPILFS